MSTYSLLQNSLEQSITREKLEEASVAVPQVARADCARLLRESVGILVSGLEWEGALAFQRALLAHQFPTVIVADDDLPTLHEPFTSQRIDVRGEALTFTDYLGRTQTRPREDLVFLAAGRVSKTEFITDRELHVSYPASARGAPRLEYESHRREEQAIEFRLDFFYCTAPHRVRLAMSDAGAIFFQGNPVRLRDPITVAGMLGVLRELLPADRQNMGMAAEQSARCYPTLTCYESELRWHFHRLEAAR